MSLVVSETWPGLLIIACILATSFLWAGLRASGFSLIHIVCLLGLSISLRHKAWQKPILLHPSLWRAFAVLLAIVFGNYLILGSSAIGRDVLAFWLDIGIAFWLVSRIPRRYLLQLLHVWIVCSAPLIAVHILYIIMSTEKINRTPSFLMHGWHFGFYAILVLFPALTLFIGSKHLMIRISGLISALLATTYLLIDVKTAPTLAFLAGIVVFGLRSTPGSFRRNSLVLLVIFLAVLSSIMSLKSSLLIDFSRTFQTDEYWTLHNDPMETALKAGLHHPILGLGVGNFESLSGPFEPPTLINRVERAHNSFLELFAETGFPGLFAALCVIAVLVGLIRAKSERHAFPSAIRFGIWISLGLAVLLGCADFGMQMPVNALTICFLVALLMADTDANSSRNIRPVTGKRSVFSQRIWMFPLILSVVEIPNLISGFYCDAAKSALDRGRLETGVRQLEIAVRMDPWDDRVRASLVEALLRLDRLKPDESLIEKARIHIDAALRFNPNRAELQYICALSESDTTDSTALKREELLSDAVRIDPTNPHYSLSLMEIRLARGDEEGALAQFDAFLDRAAVSYYSLLSDRIVDFWPDRDRFKQVIDSKIHVWPIEFGLSLCRTLSKKGLDIEARYIFEALVVRIPETTNPQTMKSCIELAFVLKDDDRALQMIESGIESEKYDKIEAFLWLSKARIAINRGDYESAVDSMKTAVKHDPGDVELRLKLAASMKKLYGPETVIAYLRQLVQDFPFSANAHLTFARELERAGMNLEALREFKQANSLMDGRLDQKIDELYAKMDIDPFWR